MVDYISQQRNPEQLLLRCQLATNKEDLREEFSPLAETGPEDRVPLRLGKHFETGMRIMGQRRAGVSAAPRLK